MSETNQKIQSSMLTCPNGQRQWAGCADASDEPMLGGDGTAVLHRHCCEVNNACKVRTDESVLCVVLMAARRVAPRSPGSQRDASRKRSAGLCVNEPLSLRNAS
jgi:hypothetical protein